MKLFLSLALMTYSAMSFAGYSCDEKDSQLTVEFLTENAVVVTHMFKRPSRIPRTKVFTGQKIEKDTSEYYGVEMFKLSGKSGEAGLKISTIPVLSRIPTCRTRVCNDIGGSYSTVEIFAELDETGKLTHYDCQKF